ncbi:MAG: DUF3450 domain-containing protein [Pseudohongiellaceae bacterium]|jgi:hypothetical protein|nr:DUF3450 domain-containing protein [Gammaproteobacteria bacterium]
MKNRHTNRLSMSGLVLLASSFFGVAQAQDILVDSSILDQAMDVIGDKYAESAVAQEEITRLANEASSTFEEFKRANDNLESLLVLNAGYRRQIAAQEEQIATLDESIASVEEVTREIPLLMEKMLSALDQFISLDYPFRMDERMARLQFARDAIDNPDVSIAEKFRQVLVMYQTEAAFGRTNETYPDTIEIGGVERDVNVVRIGRVSLMYQTTDRQVTGAWDNNARQWVELPASDYRQEVQQASRVVSNLDAPSILFLPVSAPEAQ